MKKVILKIVSSLLLSSSLYGDVTQKDCSLKGENFIYAGKECIEFAISEGEVKGVLNIIVHGTWKKGTNTLGRYAPFAETIAMDSDITTIAIALPGYSNSSTNNLKSLSHKGEENLAATKDYIVFLNDLVKSLKEKYNASTINLIGHSAGGMMSATLTGYNPNLIQTLTVAGGRFDVENNSDKSLISITNYINNIKKDTKILLIYGTKDKISKPNVTIEFYKKALKKGLSVNILKIDGAEHIGLDMRDESVEAIINMISK